MTEETQHTPGPWEFGQIEDGYIDIDAPQGDRYYVGLAKVVWKMDGEDSSTEQEANARLIAAAPELLAALKSLQPILAEIHDNWDNGMRAGKVLVALQNPKMRYRADIDAIHGAIAKAEGGAA